MFTVKPYQGESGTGTGEDSDMSFVEMHFEKFKSFETVEKPWSYRTVRYSRILNASQVANLALEVLLKFINVLR